MKVKKLKCSIRKINFAIHKKINKHRAPKQIEERKMGFKVCIF
jgi:hypothetical protein